MRIALTGASGFVGRFIADAAGAAGHEMTPLSPGTGWRLGDSPDLTGHDALVHCAFLHAPGRFRGGEGEDPDGFRRANIEGTLRLFEAAQRDAVSRVVLLSSRAVFDGWPPGTRLTEDLAVRPASLYGEVKAEAEAALPEGGCALRATGVYGPARAGQAHKWTDLFRDFLAGRPVTPRVASEVHGADLADAVLRLLGASRMPGVAHVSDLILDRRDLLARVAKIAGRPDLALPDAADPTGLNVLECRALHSLGWRPGGLSRLDVALPEMVAQATRRGPRPRSGALVEGTAPGSPSLTPSKDLFPRGG
ncbi:NAD-dependent epimerase/dehydratase family protein [Paracoccus sp. S-4012]|uniref:NAD-dependent epimerase/dehydratase family protein n=1 Tax=Paracoccus sp. S-4012 TaxID=2665648 RepID=UPI0012B09AC3|nr:NAD(P)-dependent oxidoreductase [Paracoccus sp. S-4012]MRX49804.1 NAD-dependent epimerase/dehydratase family protein [Paracoccus sp. S-4012]